MKWLRMTQNGQFHPIGINLNKNKSRSASHDKVTMYRLSYVNSHIIFKNICKFQFINTQIRIGSLPHPPGTNIQYICVVSSFVNLQS